MSNMTSTSRRQALKFLASAPMLPLGALSVSSLVAGCATSATTASTAAQSAAPFASAVFTSMAAPSLANPAAMATTTVASSLQVTLKDGTTRAFKLAYQPFFITGDRVPDGKGGTVLAGGYVDILNRPIIDKSVPGKERQHFSDCPDGTSLLFEATERGHLGHTRHRLQRVAQRPVLVRAQLIQRVPADVTTRMINNDFAWAAANKAALLDEWRKRYDGKSEPRK